MNTDIKDTWDEYLASGELVEAQVLSFIKMYDPIAHKVNQGGNFKDYDHYSPRFDIRIEVKRDFKSDETGNFFFEYMFRGDKSGISSSKADIWVMVTAKSFYIIDLERLKVWLRANWLPINSMGWNKTNCGDNGMSKGVIIPREAISVQPFVRVYDNSCANSSSLPQFLRSVKTPQGEADVSLEEFEKSLLELLKQQTAPHQETSPEPIE